MSAPVVVGDRGFDLITARHFTPATRARIDLIVIHSMEVPEKPREARNVARWFAGETAPMASAHYCIDADEIVQSVREHDVAWAAPGANNNGVHLEHAGYARQSDADWRDAYSWAMLTRSAELVRVLCLDWGIPVELVDEAGLHAGRRGITTHATVSRAFKKSTHWDPGPGFPMADYLELIRKGTATP